MPVQPVTAAGPDHSKSLEKPELYPSLFQGPDPTKGLPSISTPAAQIYPPANSFAAGHSNDAYRYEQVFGVYRYLCMRLHAHQILNLDYM